MTGGRRWDHRLRQRLGQVCEQPRLHRSRQQEQAPRTFLQKWLSRRGGFWFFFSRDVLFAQAKCGSQAVDLTDAHGELKSLLQGCLNGGTWGARRCLAQLDECGAHLSAELDGVAVPSIRESDFPFCAYFLQETIDRCSMDWNVCGSPRLLDGSSLFDLCNDEALGFLALLSCNRRHHEVILDEI